MTVQLWAVGIMCSPYAPAASWWPPTVTGVVNVMTVFSLAPARQTSLQGTSLPKTSRLFTAGRWYVIVMSVMPTRWLAVAAGLGAGSVSAGPWAAALPAAATKAIAAIASDRVLGTIGNERMRTASSASTADVSSSGREGGETVTRDERFVTRKTGARSTNAGFLG